MLACVNGGIPKPFNKPKLEITWTINGVILKYFLNINCSIITVSKDKNQAKNDPSLRHPEPIKHVKMKLFCKNSQRL